MSEGSGPDYEELDRAAKKRAKQARRDWRFVLSRGEGRRVLEEIIFELCGALEPTRSTDDPDKHGRRAVGLEILDRSARYDGDAAMIMVGERIRGKRADRDHDEQSDE